MPFLFCCTLPDVAWLTVFRDEQIVAVRSVINPDKLRHLGPLVDPVELAGG